MTTVSEYLVQRFVDLGIDTAFGLPGDFPFPELDAIEASDAMQWVGGVSELNAAYSADGYARRRGAALLVTTYGAGELSTINGLMGSKAHRLPVFLVVGSPSRRIVHQKLSTYHTLGDGVFGNFESITAAACCVKVVLTPENAIAEIERAIRVALAECAPAYIVVPQDVGVSPILGAVSTGAHLREIRRAESNPAEMEAAATAILNRLQSAARPVLLPSAITARLGLREKLQQWIRATQLPFALTPTNKGLLDESQPSYLGLYAGIQSTPQALQQQVESADLMLDLGGQLNVHINTGFWTAQIPEQAHIHVYETWVQIGEQVYVDVAMANLLDRLISLTSSWKAPATASLPYEQMPIVGEPADPTSSAGFYPRLQRMLKPGDILVVDSGSCEIPMFAMRLPAGVDLEAQVVWSSIGFATPLTMGVALAEPDRRVILLTGDGAHQETMGAIATMGFHGVKPIVFVLNNGTYGCEYDLDQGRYHYNEIAPIRYSQLPEVFGCPNWLSRQVKTIGELEDALAEVESQPNRAAYLEVMIPAKENVSFTDNVIDHIYKLKTPSGA